MTAGLRKLLLAAGAAGLAALACFQLQAEPRELPGPAFNSLKGALSAYEELRASLAADDLETVPTAAGRLTAALQGALDSRQEMTATARKLVEETVAFARSLEQPADLGAAREGFGEVSRLLLLLAGEDARLSQGRHVFSCPMIRSFPKWIQVTDTLENPYMGPAMAACGTAADWSVPGSRAAVAMVSEPAGLPSPEPEFKPGIPGLKMVDVRDHKHLWRELDELQSWERADRISISEYRAKAIEKTVRYLELSGPPAKEFASSAADAVSGLRGSFRRERLAGSDPSAGGAQFSGDLEAAVARLASLLGDPPRHQLFAPDCKKWLLKLAFGPRESKEAREAE